MPELPEVITTVSLIKKKIVNHKITEIWIDKKTKTENLTKISFKNNLKNRKIINIGNIGKYILINLDNLTTLIIHQKISGHLLFSKFIRTDNLWKNPKKSSLINDPNNRFIRFGLKFKGNQWLVLSDARRLARITLVQTSQIYSIKPIKQMGLNPLSLEWTFLNFKNKLLKHNINIKKALLMQNIVSGLGNIYSDEVLFKSKIHPQRNIQNLNEKKLKNLFKYIPLILNQSLKYHGTTFNTYRNPDGNSGSFINFLNVYQRKNRACKICKHSIQSIKINGRSSYFCKYCQK